MSPDVFVVGGGPAGLAAAIAARLRGLEVVLAEAGRPPIDKACGEGIMPAGVAAAHALGVDLNGAPLLGIRFHDGPYSASARFPGAHGRGVRRTALHTALADRASSVGVRFLWNSPVSDFDSIRARWIVGADGVQSRVRKWAGLDAIASESVRYGFRRHYAVAPWSDHVEIHWSDGFQLYVTPVASEEIGVALLCRDPQFRLDDALAGFPRRLSFPSSTDRGAATLTRRLRAVCRGNVALIGDAAGSVDAITGDGISLAFRQAESLAVALASNSLAPYSAAHPRLFRRPRVMANVLLTLDRRPALRRLAIRALAAHPPLFTHLLAAHAT